MPSTSTVAASAGGKIIVLGEHAVVYGHRALAGAVDRLVEVQATPRQGTSTLAVPDWDIQVTADDEGVPGQALRALLRATNTDPVALHATTNLPPGSGLGSSAALCLAIARCLAPGASDAEHRRIAAAGEGQFHHRPSGIDVALCQYGGIAQYDIEGGLSPLAVPPLSLVVGLSKLPRSTATQVAAVAERMKSDGGRTAAAIEGIGAQARLGIEALANEDMPALGECMNECHAGLRELGVSVPTLDSMVEIARGAGALGAKLTGAGGGGAMIALAPGRENEVVAALEEHGFPAFVTTLGARA